MKFSKRILADLDWQTPEDFTIIYTKITGNSRWSISYERVFSYKDKFYETHYSVGATEMQDEGPYEYDPDEVECKEVFPKEKTITVYEEKQ